MALISSGVTSVSGKEFVVGYMGDPNVYRKSYFFVIGESVNGQFTFSAPFSGHLTQFGRSCLEPAGGGLRVDVWCGLQTINKHTRDYVDVVWMNYCPNTDQPCAPNRPPWRYRNLRQFYANEPCDSYRMPLTKHVDPHTVFIDQ